MRKIGILCFALLLGACATVTNPLTPQRFAQIESAYGVALAVANGYRSACARGAIPRSCRAIVVQLQTAGRVAQTNVLAARAFIRNNPTLDANSIVTSAENAVQALQDIETQYGVR